MRKKPRIRTETEDFRTYEPETFTDKDGSVVTLRMCEELVDGRWEPFYVDREAGPCAAAQAQVPAVTAKGREYALSQRLQNESPGQDASQRQGRPVPQGVEAGGSLQGDRRRGSGDRVRVLRDLQPLEASRLQIRTSLDRQRKRTEENG